MDWIKQCEEKARALPKEKRQEFLDLMWAGKTIGQSSESCGISEDAAIGILNMNLEYGPNLRRESI